jgi:hypothetical protein
MNDEKKLRVAIDIVRAMMRSVDRSKIRPLDWWPRAKSALETAAASSDSYSSLISTMGRKLQIDCTAPWTGELIGALAHEVGADFEPFRAYVEREALYIVAICQAESKLRKADWEAAQEGMAASAAQLTAYTEQVINTIPVKE